MFLWVLLVLWLFLLYVTTDGINLLVMVESHYSKEKIICFLLMIEKIFQELYKDVIFSFNPAPKP